MKEFLVEDKAKAGREAEICQEAGIPTRPTCVFGYDDNKRPLVHHMRHRGMHDEV